MSIAKNLAFINPRPGSRFSAADYGPEYYEHHLGPPYRRDEPHWLEFFGKIADQIISRINPQSVLDVGCAKGFLVESLRDRGVAAFGFDISEYAIGEVRGDVKPYCWVGSATEPLPHRNDLITCIEVCEHLSEQDGRAAVRNMTSYSDAVLFSSTPSDFNEPTHLNVKPVIYWLQLFREFSFAPDLLFDGSFLTPQTVLFRKSHAEISDGVLRLYAKSKLDALSLEQRRAQVAELQTEVTRLKDALTAKSDLCEAKSRLINEKISQFEAERAHASELQDALEKRNEELAANNATLHSVLNSKGWRLLNRYRDLRGKLRGNPALRRIARPIVNRIREIPDSQTDFENWIEKYEKPSLQPALIEQAVAGFSSRPKISIIMPVYNTPSKLLDLAIQSVRAQFYPDWELCICDDASTVPPIRPLLEQWSSKDTRIKVVAAQQNGGISVASNRALAMATGDFVGLLDHDDELTPNALFEVVKLLQAHPDADMIYSDEDKLSEGKRKYPFFKPDWSPEYFLSCMYTCHFGVYRRSVLEEIGGFRQGFEGSQDYDLVLRFTEKSSRVYHIPKILYHWRMIPGSTAESSAGKPYAYIAAKRALSEHLKRRNVAGHVIDGPWLGHFRIRFSFEEQEKVSIIIPTRDKVDLLASCIDSIENKTTYRNYEILIVDNLSAEESTKAYFSATRHRVISYPVPFNYSRIVNFGADHATGKYLILLNNDTEVISPEWIEAMLGFCCQGEIGAVGAKLLFPNDRIQHAGVVLGLGGPAGHPLHSFPRRTPHAFGIAEDIRNYSAVTAACMMVRKNVFQQVGGFNEDLAAAYNDVDFCLKLREAGYRIVWTPSAELYHHESASRGYSLDPKEVAYFQERWGHMLNDDPYYNPNLTRRHAHFGPRT